MYGLQQLICSIMCNKEILPLPHNYNLGLAGFTGASKAFTPRVFSLRRYTLSPQVTYIMLNAGPPKYKLEVWLFEGGVGKIAFTLPSWSITWMPILVATNTRPAVSQRMPSGQA